MKNYIKYVLTFVLGQLTGVYGIGTLAVAALDLLCEPVKAFDTLRVAVLDDETPKEVIASVRGYMHPGIKIHSIKSEGDSVLVNVTEGKGAWAADCLGDCGFEPEEVFVGGYGEVAEGAVEALSADWF